MRLGAAGSPPSARKGAHNIASFAGLGTSKPVVRALARLDAPGHRVNRSGRAGRRGTGISLVLADQAEAVRKMAGSLGLARQLGGGRKRERGER